MRKKSEAHQKETTFRVHRNREQRYKKKRSADRRTLSNTCHFTLVFH